MNNLIVVAEYLNVLLIKWKNQPTWQLDKPAKIDNNMMMMM